jgi:hypothetical protein
MSTQESAPGWYKKKIHPTPEPAAYGLVFVMVAIIIVIWSRLKEK